MIASLIQFSIRQRWLVLLGALALAALGAYNYTRLPIDAVPDITNVQVQINTEAPGYSPLEAEQRITFPVETAMADGRLPALVRRLLVGRRCDHLIPWSIRVEAVFTRACHCPALF